MYTGRDNEPENWHSTNSVLFVLLENTTASLNDIEKRDEVDVNTVYSVAMSTKSMFNLKKKTCFTFGDGLRIPWCACIFVIGGPMRPLCSISSGTNSLFFVVFFVQRTQRCSKF